MGAGGANGTEKMVGVMATGRRWGAYVVKLVLYWRFEYF